MEAIRDDPAVNRIRVRSPLTCDAELGVCARCYGRSLATGQGDRDSARPWASSPPSRSASRVRS